MLLHGITLPSVRTITTASATTASTTRPGPPRRRTALHAVAVGLPTVGQDAAPTRLLTTVGLIITSSQDAATTELVATTDGGPRLSRRGTTTFLPRRWKRPLLAINASRYGMGERRC
jgi:hypothetical protein